MWVPSYGRSVPFIVGALAGGTFPPTDSSPYAISLTCPSANTRIRSHTRGLGADRSKLDTGLRPVDGNEFLLFHDYERLALSNCSCLGDQWLVS